MGKRLTGDMKELKDQLSCAQKKMSFYKDKIAKIKRAIKYRSGKRLMSMLPNGKPINTKTIDDLSIFGIEIV